MKSKGFALLVLLPGIMAFMYLASDLLRLPSTDQKSQLPTQSAPIMVEVKVGYDLYGVGTTASLQPQSAFVPYTVELVPAPEMMLKTQALVALGVEPDKILCDSLCASYAEVSKDPQRLLSWYGAVRLYTLIGGEYAEIRLISEEILESWRCWVKGIVLIEDLSTLMVWYSFNGGADRTSVFAIKDSGLSFLSDGEGVDHSLGYFGEDMAVRSGSEVTAVVTTTGKVQVYDHEGTFHIQLSPCSRETTNVLQELVPEGNES